MLKLNGYRQRERHLTITKNKKKLIILLPLALIIIIAVIQSNSNEPENEILKKIKPLISTIRTSISSTGTVQPQNRLEIMPPINGRIDRILVREGNRVKAGTILAWMSSNERAALIDSARTQSKSTLEYWQKAYKPIPLIAPISGMIIVRSVEPGQTVSSTSPVLVLSDRLIVKAEIDETDIGKIKIGQKTIISLDAYPDVEANGRVNHISYESKVINNVTIYEVDILPEKVPAVFRSGMSANIEIIQEEKKGIPALPAKAVETDIDGISFVAVKDKKSGKIIRKTIETGISNETLIEIVSGIKMDDTVILKLKKFESRDDKTAGRGFFGRPRPKKK